MHEQVPLEQRVAALEDEVSLLKKRLEGTAQQDRENWVDKISGSMKEFPEFDEVVKLGAEIRRADSPTDNEP